MKLGPYRLEKLLASGGMSEVYLAVHTHPTGFKRTVVVKKLPVSEEHNPVSRHMLAQEASVAAQVQHPCTVALLDFTEVEGLLLCVMEHVDGCDLRTLLQHVRNIPSEVACAVVGCVAQALAHAHAQGVFHRDVHPGNILIGRDGGVKLADFGVAKSVQHHAFHTHKGLVKGTLGYMAPEQLRGEPLTASCDQYALGAVLKDMLTPQAPMVLHQMVQTLMCAHPQQRFETMQDVKEACFAQVPCVETAHTWLQKHVQHTRSFLQTFHGSYTSAHTHVHVQNKTHMCALKTVVCVLCVAWPLHTHDIAFKNTRTPLVSSSQHAPSEGALSLRMSRGWAKVYKPKDVYVGQTPLFFSRMASGTHTVWVQKPGSAYKHPVRVNVLPRQTHVYTVQDTL
jgi:serine/threonine protein kinase